MVDNSAHFSATVAICNGRDAAMTCIRRVWVQSLSETTKSAVMTHSAAIQAALVIIGSHLFQLPAYADRTSRQLFSSRCPDPGARAAGQGHPAQGRRAVARRAHHRNRS